MEEIDTRDTLTSSSNDIMYFIMLDIIFEHYLFCLIPGNNWGYVMSPDVYNLQSFWLSWRQEATDFPWPRGCLPIITWPIQINFPVWHVSVCHLGTGAGWGSFIAKDYYRGYLNCFWHFIQLYICTEPGTSWWIASTHCIALHAQYWALIIFNR